MTAIESLSCLRGTGMSVQDMRAPELGTLADLLGRPTLVSAGKATKLIAWQPRSAADTVSATGESLLQQELVQG